MEEYRYQVQVLIQKLLLDQQLTQLIASHKGLADPEGYAEKFLDTPGYFSSLLIFCEEQHIPFSDSLRDLIGTRGRLPRLEDKWMEKLLQGFLYDDVDSYPECDGKREEVLTRLKQAGCIYRNKVVLTKNKEINKLLSKSKGKLNSIEKIVETEYNNLGSELRLLILCDFIKKDKLPFVGAEETMVAELGAVPIFEHLRKTQESSVRLGILSGTVVLLPLDIEQDLKGLMEEHSCEGNLIPIRETGYGQLQVKGKNTAVVAVVTEFFTQGKINVLVGTKSLLGEGWDAPCINSLILATYVGSFMLSNQMRGRAIRIDRSHPEKTGNIWHLACVFPENEGAKKGAVLTGDYETLVQRFSTFLGLSWEENVIESGLDRLGIPGFNSKVEMDDINAAMLAKASDREAVRARWSQSLKEIHGDMEVEQAQTMEAKQMPKGFVFVNGIKLVILVVLDAMLGFNAYQGGWVPGGGRYSSDTLPVVVIALIMACISAAIASYGVKLFQLGKPDKRMRKVGEAIEKALEEIGEIDASEDHMVKVDTEEGILLNVWLTGGTMRDKSTFAACMEEFWGVIDNPRYLFAPKWRSIFTYSYYSVPEVFARKKDRTQIFEKHMRKVMGNYHAIYTRNAEGRKILLEARTRSFVNISQAILNGKKVVKGKYE